MFISKSKIDRFIRIVDAGLRSVVGTQQPTVLPIDEECELTYAEAKKSAQLMRVNHTGEVCAQGLYEGQALVARDKNVREHLMQAAAEERVHLDWCKTRLIELRSSTSALTPFFFGASVGLGVISGLLGDRISLGFVEATEDEVCKHLDRHLNTLSGSDVRSHSILKKIRLDEERHQRVALQDGGIEFPQVMKRAMAAMSRVMTETTKHF